MNPILHINLLVYNNIKKNTSQMIGILLVCTSMSSLLAHNFHNPNEMLRFVKQFLPENPIILEAGAHYGEDTVNMKSIWPKATMHVFEPLPQSFNKIMKLTKHLPNVMAYNYALSNYIGKTNFYLNPNNDGASSVGKPVDFNKNEFIEIPLEVSCITLDEWAKVNNVSRIDFMWLDMEGHELYALQHASTILDSVQAIYTEVNYVHTREGACLYTDLKNFLISRGFKEIWKESFGRFGNALFTR